jgi:hypothetical protein
MQEYVVQTKTTTTAQGVVVVGGLHTLLARGL